LMFSTSFRELGRAFLKTVFTNICCSCLINQIRACLVQFTKV
jgi:hypothetical protein